jgi:hypothetical protein
MANVRSMIVSVVVLRVRVPEDCNASCLWPFALSAPTAFATGAEELSSPLLG